MSRPFSRFLNTISGISSQHPEIFLRTMSHYLKNPHEYVGDWGEFTDVYVKFFYDTLVMRGKSSEDAELECDFLRRVMLCMPYSEPIIEPSEPEEEIPEGKIVI